MNIADELKSNFPNLINKGKPIFKALVANNEHTGVFETVLQDIKDYSDDWISTPDIYEQTGEMLELTSRFFTYLEQYTSESDEAYKKRIKTIFVRNNDTSWGGPLDIKNVFRSYFPTANIFLVENVEVKDAATGLDGNLLKDGDFEDKSTNWIGVDENKSSPCHYDRDARFSKGYGVMIKEGGEFYQIYNFENEDKDYIVNDGDTFKSISKLQYGTELKAGYIMAANPDIVEPLIQGSKISIPPLNTMFLHYFLNGACKIQITNNKGQYWDPTIFKNANGDYEYGSWVSDEYTIDHDTIGRKYKVPVIFYRTIVSGEVVIPKGTIVTDGIHNFITAADDVIRSGESQSYGVYAVAEKVGVGFKVAAGTVNIIKTPIGDDITVNNPKSADDGTDTTGQISEVELIFSLDNEATENIKIPIGTIVSDGIHKFTTINDGVINIGEKESYEITAHAIEPGYEYNVDANTINIVESFFGYELKVNNPNAAGGGTDYGWDNKSLFFICDNTISNVKIKFLGSEKLTGLIDYVRLYKKGPYPSFSIIASFNNFVAKDAAALFPGDDDEELIKPRYDNASYYDNDFLSGLTTGGYALDLYQDLLEYVKAVGVKAYIEIVNRDE